MEDDDVQPPDGGAVTPLAPWPPDAVASQERAVVAAAEAPAAEALDGSETEEEAPLPTEVAAPVQACRVSFANGASIRVDAGNRRYITRAPSGAQLRSSWGGRGQTLITRAYKIKYKMMN